MKSKLDAGQVCQLKEQGFSNRQIARDLGTSEASVRRLLKQANRPDYSSQSKPATVASDAAVCQAVQTLFALFYEAFKCATYHVPQGVSWDYRLVSQLLEDRLRMKLSISPLEAEVLEGILSEAERSIPQNLPALRDYLDQLRRRIARRQSFNRCPVPRRAVAS